MPLLHELQDLEGLRHLLDVVRPLGAVDYSDGQLVVVLAGAEHEVEGGVTFVSRLLDVTNAESREIELVFKERPEYWQALSGGKGVRGRRRISKHV